MRVVPTWGLMGVLGALVLGLLAFAVARHGAGRRSNAWLAFALAVEGFVTLTGNGLLYLTDSATVAWSMKAATAAGFPILAFAWFGFFSTFETPVGRMLRTRLALAVGVLLVIASEAFLIVAPRAFVLDVFPAEYAPFIVQPGPALQALYAGSVLVSAVGLVLAIDVFRRARASPSTRARARAYAIAFGAHDVGSLLVNGVLPALFRARVGSSISANAYDEAFTIGIPLVEIVFASLVAYGILRSQLFDIDLKIKTGIRRGTVGTLVAVIGLVVEKLVEFYLNQAYGVLFGGIAAGLTALFLASRLNKLGEKLADKTMPDAKPTSAYVAYKKLEVYRAALESAHEQEGGMTDRERAVLARLRAKLDIAEADASAIEAELEPARAPRDASPAT